MRYRFRQWGGLARAPFGAETRCPGLTAARHSRGRKWNRSLASSWRRCAETSSCPRSTPTYEHGRNGRFVRHARTHVPFYRESGRLDPLFRRDGTIDWERWAEVPPLKRQDLQREFERLKAESVPPGHGQIFTLSTSGSSGEPVKVLAPERARRWAWAALRLRDFEWHAIDTAKRLAYLRPFEPDHFDATGVRRYPKWNEAFGQYVPAGERVELADTRPAAELVDMIAAIQPAYLHVQPTALQLMVAHDGKRRLSDLGLPRFSVTANIFRAKRSVTSKLILAVASSNSSAPANAATLRGAVRAAVVFISTPRWPWSK